MRKATVTVKGISPLSWSRFVDTAQLEGEDKQAMEERIWKDRFWCDRAGTLLVPQMAIKNSLVDAAQYLGEKIAGRGNKTWTGKFAAGILVLDPMSLGVTKDALEAEWLMVPGTPGKGKRGTGSRVKKCFPRLTEWGGAAEVYIADEDITEKAFTLYMETVGKFVGWGRFRPDNRGFYGRFEVVSVKFQNANS